jgi:hypothetical protein
LQVSPPPPDFYFQLSLSLSCPMFSATLLSSKFGNVASGGLKFGTLFEDKLFYYINYSFSRHLLTSQPGVRVPLGVHEKLTGGTPSFKKTPKQVYFGRIFDLGEYAKGVQI